MIMHDVEQRSAEWFNLRCGRITASNAHRLTTDAKLKTYVYELIGERITGTVSESFETYDMLRGIELEPEAISYYEFITDQEVTRTGFVEVDEYVGFSPDGLIGDDGGLEIKCLNPKNHVSFSLNGPNPEHIYQVQFALLFSERKWWDLVAYDDRPNQQSFKMFKQRFEPEEKYIKKIEEGIEKAKDMMNEFFERYGN